MKGVGKRSQMEEFKGAERKRGSSHIINASGAPWISPEETAPLHPHNSVSGFALLLYHIVFSFFFIKSFSHHSLLLYQKWFYLLRLNYCRNSFMLISGVCIWYALKNAYSFLSFTSFIGNLNLRCVCPCPIFCSYRFSESGAIVWHNLRATTSVACRDGVLWSWALHVWLISGHLESHCGLVWTLGISGRVEWEANCMVISSATHRLLGKQARV